jgi:hypothetical protein
MAVEREFSSGKQTFDVSPAARKAHHGNIRSVRSDDRVRVPLSRMEARQRQGARAGVDRVGVMRQKPPMTQPIAWTTP